MSISASTARKVVFDMVEHNEHIADFMKEVMRSAKAGLTTFVYPNMLTDVEEEYLRSLGYRVDWNRAAQWYEISF